MFSAAGEVPEWLNGPVLKTGVRASVPWVRIPPSPPYITTNPLIVLRLFIYFNFCPLFSPLISLLFLPYKSSSGFLPLVFRVAQNSYPGTPTPWVPPTSHCGTPKISMYY